LRKLGYKPKVNIEQGVAAFVRWYKDYYGVN
jgi:nucleoside-diphosphate-sugar epimerase